MLLKFCNEKRIPFFPLSLFRKVILEETYILGQFRYHLIAGIEKKKPQKLAEAKEMRPHHYLNGYGKG